MRQATTKKLIVYPNLGAQYDPETKTWAKSEQQLDFTQLTEKWYQAGASIIGGCCMTTSPQISQIATYLEQYQKENGIKKTRAEACFFIRLNFLFCAVKDENEESG